MSIMSRAELRSLPMLQQPSYPDEAALDRVIDTMEKLPPLVFAGECDDLRSKLAEVAEGRAFLLQGGDCAESFDAVTAQHIKDKLLVQLSMAVVMTYAAQVPVVKVGRIAGQYAKPRSKPTETRDGVTLPSYRGDAINGFDFTQAERVHDPERLIRVYNASAATLNLVRAFVKGGFADLRGVHTWNRDFVGTPDVEAAYEELAAEIDRALTFMVACGVEDRALSTIDFYASHEALLLEYESAMTRIDSRTGEPYNTSAHFLWAGERAVSRWVAGGALIVGATAWWVVPAASAFLFIVAGLAAVVRAAGLRVRRTQVGTVRGGRRSLVLGELATVRTTQVNTLMMLAVALVFTYTMASRGLIIPMTMAFVVVNTPLNAYFSRYLSTRAVVMAAPGSRRVMAAYARGLALLYMASNCLVGVFVVWLGGGFVETVVAGVVASLAGAVTAVLLEIYWPLTSWKSERDVMRHPRKYLPPAAALLAILAVHAVGSLVV